MLRSSACLFLSTMSRHYERCETMIKRVWCSTVALEPSKLSVRVRISSPAPDSVRSSVWSEHRLVMAGDAGSNPVAIRPSGSIDRLRCKRGWGVRIPSPAPDSTEFGHGSVWQSAAHEGGDRRFKSGCPSGLGGSPVAPTVFDAKRGSSSIGRASACHAEGRGFEPPLPLQIPTYCRRCGFESRQGLSMPPWCNWLAQMQYERLSGGHRRLRWQRAGIAQWQSPWFPTRKREFDSLYPLQ